MALGTHRKQDPYRRQTMVLSVVLLILAAAVVWAALRPSRLPGEEVGVPEYVERAYLPPNAYSRPEFPLEEIRGVVIHYVGNPATTAEANRNYFASLASGTEETYASSHFIVGLEGEVLQCVPLTEIAYATMERNADTVSVEVCHPDETGEFLPPTYDRTVELTAWLCHTFDLTPETDVIRHYDVTGKICPKYYVEHPQAWEAFLSAVNDELARQEVTARE